MSPQQINGVKWNLTESTTLGVFLVLWVLKLIYQTWGIMAGLSGLPAIGAVSILELATNSGSSRMSHTPKHHLAMQLSMQRYLKCFQGKKGKEQ